MTEARPVESLWRDYLLLTREIAKFLARKDVEMAASLIEQRGRLQEMIESAPDRAFAVSAAGQDLLGQIKAENAMVVRQMQLLRNQDKQQRTVEQAYSQTAFLAGGYFNRRG